jgi:hypothetical protein
MSSVILETLPGNRYRITDGSHEIVFGSDRFEDLYYAVPTHPTQFYRLLTDQVCQNQADRDAINSILDATGDREVVLREIMTTIQELPKP